MTRVATRRPVLQAGVGIEFLSFLDKTTERAGEA